jgi:transcriptional regulator of acetoin/glycerol metabolism
VKIFNRKLDKNISIIPKNLLTKLKNYNWPGNIRELENTIERAMILSKDNTLSLDSHPLEYQIRRESRKFTTLEDVEKKHILSVLIETNWRIRGTHGAAEILGMKPTTLESRIKKLGISRQSNSEI